MKSSASSRVAVVLSVAVFLGALSGLITNPASAWVAIGCKYAGTNPTIQYSFNQVTTAYQNHTHAAAGNWNASTAAGTFTTAASANDVIVSDGAYAGSWWAQVAWTGCNPVWGSNTTWLSYDTTDMSSLTTNQKRIVGTHELGHSLGLGDLGPRSLCAATPEVMYQGSGKFGCVGTPPWPEDVAGVNAIY